MCLGGCISYDNSPDHGIYKLNKTNFAWHEVGEFPYSACTYTAISLVEMKDVLPFCEETTRPRPNT